MKSDVYGTITKSDGLLHRSKLIRDATNYRVAYLLCSRKHVFSYDGLVLNEPITCIDCLVIAPV